MIIDPKLPGHKTYLNEYQLNNGGIKTTIDQAAIAPSEQNNVDLHLEDSTKNSHDSYKKKKEKKKESKKESKENIKKIILTDSEIKEKNLKLLNML